MNESEFWDVHHPVLEILRKRRKDGSKPGERRDGAKVALAVEGGGMRGIVSCAMLSALEDYGFSDAFDDVFGGSSGAVNAAYFLAGDVWFSLSIYYDDLATRSFIDVRRGLRGDAIFDVDFAFDQVFDLIKPLDYAAVLGSQTPLHVAVTLVDKISGVALSDFKDGNDLKSALRAGAWLPLATKGTANFRGERAIDGGVVVAHPSTFAINGDFTHVLSLSTRPNATGRQRPSLMQRYVARHLNAMRSGLGSAYLEGAREYSTLRRRLNRERTAPMPDPYILDLRPGPNAPMVKRHEIRTSALFVAARDAYETMMWALEGHRQRAIPRFSTAERSHRLT